MFLIIHVAVEGSGWKRDKVYCKFYLYMHVFVHFFGLDHAQNTIVVYFVLRNRPISYIIHAQCVRVETLCTVIDLSM